jgi:hypothetical protein
MAEKVNLVCKGTTSKLSVEAQSTASAIRTYIIEDENLLKAEELDAYDNSEWFCRWSESEINCGVWSNIESNGKKQKSIGSISIDRLSGSLQSLTEVRSSYLDNFIATCEVVAKNKF